MEEQVKEALAELKRFVQKLSRAAQMEEGYAEKLWSRIEKSNGILREVAYFHDTGEFWCGYQIEGYTLADILVWQVDHFKAYMDRHQEMNRYRRERLFLESLEQMLNMEENPESVIGKMRRESGNDSQTITY